jgi:hypothetical protein
MRILNRTVLVAVVAAAMSACGDVARTGRSPVYLVIENLQAARGDTPDELSGFLLSDVITNITTPAPCSDDNPCPTVFNDPGQAVLRIALKDIGPAASPTTPTTNNEVTITRVRVTFRRTDGRNVQGVDVPYAFETAATATVPGTDTATISFNLVRHSAKEEAPLLPLRVNPRTISTIADVTFIGRDRVGNDISATGSIGVEFGNFGD